TSAALLAGVGAVLLPTMVIWSVVTLKETAVLFLALLGLWVVQFLSDAPRNHPRFADALILEFAVVAVLLDLRSTTAAILVGLLALVYFVRSRLHPNPRQLALIGLTVVVVAGGGLWVARARTTSRPVTSVIEDAALQIRHRRAQEAASAR